MSNHRQKVTRRDFIGRSVKMAAGLTGFSLFGKSAGNLSGTTLNKSQVVVVKDEGVILNAGGIDQNVLQRMMDAGIRQVTGIDNIGEAWKSLFPGITQSKTISIKVNCIARQDNPTGLATHPETVFSIINGLKQMQVEGSSYPEENIIIWDRSDYELVRSDYTINKGSTGIKCYGTRENISQSGNSLGYFTGTLYDVGGSGQYLSKILVEQTDYMINLSLMKNHVTSGVTFSLKNNYGCCWAPLNMHGNDCISHIAPLNALSPIKDKQVISICDALYAIISGGPMGSPQVIPKSLLFSKDPVAHDYIGARMLRDLGSPTTDRLMSIIMASYHPYNLGTSDLNQIDVVTIENPATGIEQKEDERIYPDDFKISQNYPNPFNAQTTIAYRLNKPAQVKLNIFNIQGIHIKQLINEYNGPGSYRISWDGRSSAGTTAASGTYLGVFKIGDFKHTIRMQLVK